MTRVPTSATPFSEEPSRQAGFTSGEEAIRMPDLPRRMKELRIAAGITLKELGQRASISMSALSKIENRQMSPTYEYIVRLAHGLGVDIAALFDDGSTASATGRRSIVRKGGGVFHDTGNYVYEMLCTDLSQKRMIPALVRVKARSIGAFPTLISHEGDDLLYVVSGAIMLYTEFYAPTRLSAGDSAYFDSKMGHACISVSEEDAMIFWTCSEDLPSDLSPIPVDLSEKIGGA